MKLDKDSPEAKALFSKYDAAAKRIKECKPNDNSAEREYGIASQNLVKAGLMMGVKKKYRNYR